MPSEFVFSVWNRLQIESDGVIRFPRLCGQGDSSADEMANPMLRVKATPYLRVSPFFVSILIFTWAFLLPAHSAPSQASIQILRLPLTRDAGLSSVDGEQTGNAGQNPRLKLKGQQESLLLDIDPVPLSGQTIREATLHVRSASPEWPLARVGVSTVASTWKEGTAEGYRPQKGSACFAQAELGCRDWGPPDGNLMDVVFGMGGTFWRFADATPPDRDGWQKIPVDPKVLAARVAGISHGFLLWDEVGNEWSCRDGELDYRYFPNRFVYSRESLKSGPWLDIRLGLPDTQPPSAIPKIRFLPQPLPEGEARFRWVSPKDQGPAGTIGFFGEIHGPNGPIEIPRYQIPMAGEGGQPVSLHLRHLSLKSGTDYRLRLRPVDGAGNAGPWTETSFQVSPGLPSVEVPENPISPLAGGDGPFPTVGGVHVRILDLLDKVAPDSGTFFPEPSLERRSGDHLFSVRPSQIRLHAAKNETVAFQILLTGQSPAVDVSLSFGEESEVKTELFEFHYVESPEGPLPDPLKPLTGPVSVPAPQFPQEVDGVHSLIADIHVPHSTRTGNHPGTLSLRSRSQTLEIPVDLMVWNFTLPDKLSFVPEMNAYGTVSPYRGYDHYRLAHRHRTCLNRLPSGWNGRPAFAPDWDGQDFQWTKWDERLGPLLDGTAFSDLPRAGQPLDVMYLPFSENWPVEIFPHYTPSYWPEEGLDDAYQEELARAFAAFARHLDEKGWDQTRFQFYLNNKVYHRERFDQNSAPWIFDEPVNTQDFWALRWYAQLFRESVRPVQGGAALRFRADISYFRFGRDILWGLLDETYLGGNDPQTTRMWREMNRRWPGSALYEYGTANPISAPNTQPVLWCLSAWAAGADGVLPWQTIGREKSWQTADQTALFYPRPGKPQHEDPLPSVRLKAFRRGQQDVEYLTALAAALGRDRSQVAEWLRNHLNLEATVRKTHAADAGTAVFEDLSPAGLWRLRTRIGAFLSAHPARPPAAPARLRLSPPEPPPELGLVSGSGDGVPWTRKPDCADFTP
jgi:hypothetical protein